MIWQSSSGLIVLEITKAQAAQGSHQGQCDQDVMQVSQFPTIKRQLNKVNPDLLRDELSGYGAWDEVELSDHAANLQRLLWLACGDIVEGNY